MTLQYTPTFQEQYKKLPPKLQVAFEQRLSLFMVDPTAPSLRVHPLKGKYAGYWSINVTGDLRALYLLRGEELIIFALIGTHSQLFG